jgi:aryl sulfotransferase
VTRTIWLASYPKSGNTWFRMLVANLSAKNGQPIDINHPPGLAAPADARGPFDYRSLIDSSLLTHDEIDCLRPRVYEELARDGDDNEYDTPEDGPQVRFVLVHDAYRLTPRGEPLLAGRRGADGAILIVRDPRDVAPSLANHNRSSIDDAIAMMNDRQGEVHVNPRCLHVQFRQRHRGWSGHAESWFGQNDIPLCIIRFEDMKKDTAVAFGHALRFAGHPASEEDVRRAVAFADFSELRRQEQEQGFAGSPLPQSGRRFFRRGEVGAWRDELNAAQVARIEAAHAPMMRRLGYELVSATPQARAG